MSRQRVGSPSPVALIVLLALSLGICFAVFRPRSPVAHPAQPQQHQESGYIGATSCQSCHPGPHASWKASYHSTMTRPASELVEASDAPWNADSAFPQLPVKLSEGGREYQLSISQGKFWVGGPDLHAYGQALAAIRSTKEASPAWRKQKSEDALRNAPEVTREIVMLTGSHHYLAFWVAAGPKQSLRQLPFVYFLDDHKWRPRAEAFLQPPQALPHVARFNANCIQCHTVAGRPKQSEGIDETTGAFWEEYNSDVVDLGIACESCHGPGQKHVEKYQNPLARVFANGSEHKDIFLPEAEQAEHSSAVCGQCHSYFLPQNSDQWWNSGFSESFHAGQLLSDSRSVLQLQQGQTSQQVGQESASDPEQKWLEKINASANSLFWSDGSIMVGGREYNALLESPCYENGEGKMKMSCLSCHSMHRGAPNDQLAPEFTNSATEQNQMCEQCHTMNRSHSRHSPQSVGSQCVNCHMPKTSYALLSAIRSHRITTPQVIPAPSGSGADNSQLADSPQACALCHADRGRNWLNRELALWNSPKTKKEVVPPRQPTAEKNTTLDELPWALHLALSGDAAQRAVVLSALSSEETQKTSGLAPFYAVLPEFRRDPYSAIAHMAERAEAKLKKQKLSLPQSPPPAAAAFELTAAQIKSLLAQRNQRPVVISE